MPKPMLDDLELQQTQRIASVEEEVYAEHAVPVLEGDFLQDLGRRAVRLEATAVLSGPEARDRVSDLREKFRAAEPMPFVADIATATRIDPVLIESLQVRERAGRPDCFEVAIALREFIAPPAPGTEDPPIIPPDPPVEEIGALVVEVIVDGRPEFDFSSVTVTAQENGGGPPRTLTGRTGNVWTEEGFPPGSYQVRAVVESPEPMSGEEHADVRAGETTEVTIHLRPGVAVAKAFIIHYRFDRAFVEPCLREVLRRAVDRSNAHPEEKLLIVGHTDRVGSGDYNQLLSERRARGVWAFLSFGREREAAIEEWDQLRRDPSAVGAQPGLADHWGNREVQYMLQDLGFYVGNIDEQASPELTAAIAAFQTSHGRTATGALDDPTWRALVAAYMEQDSFAVPAERFFRNAKDACDGGVLKWLGCGEQEPVRNTEDAWRPNRRTELLFVRAERLPCDVPQPVTFNRPTPGFVGSTWCLGPGNVNKRGCFATRDANERGKWLIQPAEPGRLLVSGTITFEDGTPVPNAEYALAAADGEYLHTNDAGEADLGEVPKTTAFSPDHPTQAGKPIPDHADDQGRFSYPKETPEGIYILEIFGLARPQVAREKDEAPEEARGNVICLEFRPGPAGGAG